MDIVGAYEIPISAYDAEGNYGGGFLVWVGGNIARTSTYSGRGAKIWGNVNAPKRTLSSVPVGISWSVYSWVTESSETSLAGYWAWKYGDAVNYTSDIISSQQINTQSSSEQFTFAKNGNHTRYNSGTALYSRGGYFSGESVGYSYRFEGDGFVRAPAPLFESGYNTVTRSEAFYDFYSSSGDFSEERKLTTSTTSSQRKAQSSTREMYVEQRTTTTTTISSTVPTTSSASSTSTSTTFSISTFKQTYSTTSSRYWGYVTTSGSTLGFSVSWSSNSEYSASRSGASAFNTWSQDANGSNITFVSTPSMSESESSSASESSTRFEPAVDLGLLAVLVTVTSSISVLLNDGETYWYVNNSQGDWSAPLSKTESSFTSTFEAVILNRAHVIVGYDGLDKVVYWDNESYNGKVVTRSNAFATEDTSGVTVSGTGSAKARAVTYTNTSLLSSRRIYSNAYPILTTTSVTFQYGRDYQTEQLLIKWITGNSRTYSGFTESGTSDADFTWKGLSATTRSSSIEGLDKWLWGIGGYGGPSPVVNLGFSFFPYLNASLTTDTGFVAPDASASFHTKLPEFGNWNGRTALANPFLGAGMPKLVKTTTNNTTQTTYTHTWDNSGDGATNANQPVGYTNSNWCIIPRGNNNFSSCYKMVNGFFASPLQSRQYAIVGGGINNFPFTAVLCDREKNYTLSSTVINNALTSGSPAFPEVTVSSSVVDLEIRVGKSAFFDASFNKQVFEAVNSVSANSVQADEAVRWMQGFESPKTFVRTSSTSTTSSTEPPPY